MRRPHASHGRRLIAAGAIVATLAGSAVASAADMTWTNTPMTFTGVTVYNPDSSTRATSAGVFQYTIDGVKQLGFCVDLLHTITPGTYSVTQSERDMAAVDDRAISWIMANRTPAWSDAPTAAQKAQGRIAQLAVWVLSDQVRETNPTSDAALNTAVAALVAEARTAAATPTFVTLSADTPTPGTLSAVVRVAGRPGAVVDLTIPSGDADLSAPRVTLDASGAATVTLTRLTPGPSTVAARTDGDGVLHEVRPVVPANQAPKQTTVYRTPSTIDAQTVVTFTAAPVVTTTTTPTPPTPPTTTTTTPNTVTPSGTPATAVPPVAPSAPAPSAPVAAVAPTPAAPAVVVQKVAPPALAIAKTGPARARAGQTVRYVIVVRNTGKAAAVNVRVQDIVPSGLSVTDRGNGTVAGGRVRWTIPELAPGARRTFVVTMTAGAKVTGMRANRAVATMTGQTVNAVARTTFTAIRPAQVAPAVTG